MNRKRTGRHALLRLAAFGLLAALPLALMVFTGRAQVTTDLFALLPQEERDPLLADAIAQSRDAFFDQLDIVIHAPADARSQAAAAATQVANALRDAPVELRSASEQRARLLAAYRANPFQWLTERERHALVENPDAAFRAGVGRLLARPGQFDPTDPAGFLDNWISGLPAPAAEWTLVDDFPARVTSSGIAVYLNGALTGHPMQVETQDALNRAMQNATAAMRSACAECELHWTGAVRFSEATRLAAQSDVKRLAAIGMLGIILLFALSFRSVRPLFAAVAILASGVAVGLAASFAVFGSVHVLTLVFGTTLLGLSVDYVLHFLVHRWAHPSHEGLQALRAVRPGLVLGLLTSMTAFMFLLFADFPALSQLAVFSAAGLLTAFGLVCLWLPDGVRPPAAANPLARLAATPPRLDRRVRYALLAALAVAALGGVPSLQVVDDVRGLQAVPDELARADARVRELTRGLPGRGGSDFFLVQGENLDDALRREAELLGREGFGLSRFLLTQQQRQQNVAALAGLFEGTPPLAEQALADFGFNPELAQVLHETYAQRADEVAPTEQLLRHPGLEQLAALRVVTADGVALIARPDPDAVITPTANVRHVQPLEEVQATFGAIRVRAILAVAGAYLLMLLILTWRYGPRDGVRVLAPALLGAGCAVGLLGLAGLPLNIFSLVALILVLGVGADYALFLREGHAYPDTARLATGLAAMTSMLSFGLLVFSNLPALRAFGFATAAGILTAWLAAPLALPRVAARADKPIEESRHDRAA